MEDWPDNTQNLPHCMPSAASSPRENFGSSTVKIGSMNDARNQNWEEKKLKKIRTEFNSAALHIVEIWLQGLFCPSQIYSRA